MVVMPLLCHSDPGFAPGEESAVGATSLEYKKQILRFAQDDMFALLRMTVWED